MIPKYVSEVKPRELMDTIYSLASEGGTMRWVKPNALILKIYGRVWFQKEKVWELHTQFYLLVNTNTLVKSFLYSIYSPKIYWAPVMS